MDYEKTGRLIKKKRLALGLTQLQLSEMLAVTPQAVSLWEKGKRFPDASAQIMLFRVLDLNPVELLIGLEMFDEELKNGIASYMNRIDETVMVAGMWKDEDDNDIYLDFSGFDVVLEHHNDGCAWKVPFTEYYNVLPAPRYTDPNALPESLYDPGKIYINDGDCIFVIPVEILEAMGRPRYFSIISNEEKAFVGLRFVDETEENVYDIPEKVYNGKWKGLHVFSEDFGRDLCKRIGIRRMWDLVSIEPICDTNHKIIILQLDRAKRVNVKMNYQSFLLPQCQYETLWTEDEEWGE